MGQALINQRHIELTPINLYDSFIQNEKGFSCVLVREIIAKGY